MSNLSRSMHRRKAHQLKKLLSKLDKLISRERGKHASNDEVVQFIVSKLSRKDLKNASFNPEFFRKAFSSNSMLPSFDHFVNLVTSELFELAMNKKREK